MKPWRQPRVDEGECGGFTCRCQDSVSIRCSRNSVKRCCLYCGISTYLLPFCISALPFDRVAALTLYRVNKRVKENLAYGEQSERSLPEQYEEAGATHHQTLERIVRRSLFLLYNTRLKCSLLLLSKYWRCPLQLIRQFVVLHLKALHLDFFLQNGIITTEQQLRKSWPGAPVQAVQSRPKIQRFCARDRGGRSC